jgi:predicted RNase H-like nuclease
MPSVLRSGRRLVAGLDGCRAGWVLAVTPADARHRDVEIVVVPHVTDALAMDVAAIAIDIPIGIPDAGRRPCDDDARAFLGPRRSSVFPAPIRAQLAATTYEDALAAGRAIDGRGLSQQAWNLVSKMAEVDAALDGPGGDRLFECHPEASFALLAGAPMRDAKRTLAGALQRVAALSAVFADVGELAATRYIGGGSDDVLDAMAAAWSARRILAGTARRFGGGECDGRGRVMQMLA